MVGAISYNQQEDEDWDDEEEYESPSSPSSPQSPAPAETEASSDDDWDDWIGNLMSTNLRFLGGASEVGRIGAVLEGDNGRLLLDYGLQPDSRS